MKKSIAVLIAACVFALPSSSAQAFTYEYQCYNPLSTSSYQSQAAFYNDARYGAFNWIWNGDKGYPYVTFAVNWTYRNNSNDVECRASWYAEPKWDIWGHQGNRCQWYGHVRDSGYWYFSTFEQCFNF